MKYKNDREILDELLIIHTLYEVSAGILIRKKKSESL